MFSLAIKGVRNRKHLALLIVLVTAAIIEPLAAKFSERVLLVGVSVAAVINLGVLLVIFERRWERFFGVFLVALIFGADILHELSPYSSAAVFYHCFAASFFAFAVAVILIRIFQRQTIRTDDVIGALCGYLLAAAAWGNVYALAYFFRPASFRIADGIASQFGDWHLQRFFFGYFSVTNGHGTKMSLQNPFVPLAESQVHIINPANFRRALDDSVEDRLYIRGRAADDPEDFGCRSLML